MTHPGFLDERVLTISEAASVLARSAYEMRELLWEGKEPLLIDAHDPNDDVMTWAEFTTLALFLRCDVSVMEYTLLVGHDPYVAGSREAVVEIATQARPAANQALIGRLRGWNALFEANEEGWAVRCYPQGRNVWPQVLADGTVETVPGVSRP